MRGCANFKVHIGAKLAQLVCANVARDSPLRGELAQWRSANPNPGCESAQIRAPPLMAHAFPHPPALANVEGIHPCA
jgi:hypothetical protein